MTTAQPPKTPPLISHPNPDLTVGAGNKQGWNQPQARRQGFHGAHLLFRRSLMLRARAVLTLHSAPCPDLAARVAQSRLTAHPAFSALVIAQGQDLLFETAARDFATDRPHSMQSITKLHLHLIYGALFAQGRAHPDQRMGEILPDIGPAYAQARIGDVLDMNIENDFSEDYANPLADCYREEAALGWRLLPSDPPELRLRDFVASLTATRHGQDLTNRTTFANYKSANTDALTLVAAELASVSLTQMLETIVDAAGYDGGFHISLSPDGYPAFSGGGCLSARDMARFGLLFARSGTPVSGPGLDTDSFTKTALTRPAPTLSKSRHWQRYSHHVMCDDRRLGHAGYGGQYLMVDMHTGRVGAFFSVLENDEGYDETYMADVVAQLQSLLA